MAIDNGHFGTMFMHSGVNKTNSNRQDGFAFGRSTEDGRVKKVQGGRPRRLRRICEEHLNRLKGKINICGRRMRRSKDVS